MADENDVIFVNDIGQKGHEGAAEHFALWMKCEFPERRVVVGQELEREMKKHLINICEEDC